MGFNARTIASISRYKRAKELVAGGMPMSKATEEVGIGSMSWYKFAAMDKKGQIPEDIPTMGPGSHGPAITKKAKATLKSTPKPKQQEFIDLQSEIAAQPKNGNVTLVVCTLDQLAPIIRGLR